MQESSFRRHLEAMDDADIIAVDTETTGLNVKDNSDYCMGISVSYRLGSLGIMSAYFPFRHESDNLPKEWLADLWKVLENKPLVFHNLKFDLHSLATMGLVPLGKVYDTVLLAHLVDENLPSLKLDYLSRKFLGESKYRDKVGVWTDTFGWASVPASIMADYAQQDAELTLRLFECFWPKMREQELHLLWPVERRFARLLTKIEAVGVGVDSEFCAYMQRKGDERMQDIVDELGFDPAKVIELEGFFFDHLKLPVLKVGKPTKRWPNGRPSMDKHVMAEYEEMLEWRSDKSAQLVLEFRGWQKAVTSLYKPLQERVSRDGRIRCNFKQHGTVTGRLSCSEPNLQQIPRRTDRPWNGQAKRSFVASEGWELIGYDYAQLEFRLAAAYGRERWLLEEFSKEDGDVFTALANQIGAERQVAKTYTYATIYGAGKGKIAATLGRTESEIEETYDRFTESISGIKHVAHRATQRATARGFVKLWSGRRRHFPYSEDCHKAFNSLLQGGGAELVKRAMIAIDDDPRIDQNECRIVLQVHDEILFEIKEGCREKYEPFIVEHMLNFPEFGVRFAVEGKVWNK